MGRVIVFMLGVFWSNSLWAQTVSGKSNPVEISIKSKVKTADLFRPVITWLYPKADANTLVERKSIIKVGINSQSSIKQVTLLVNDQEVETYKDLAPAANTGYQFEAFIQKPLDLILGVNKIEIVVQDEFDVVLKQKRTLLVKPPTTKRRDRALLFAFDEYDTWENVAGPVKDTELLAKKLETCGFEIEIIRNATTFEVLEKLDQYARKEYNFYDQLLVHFSGRGEFDERLGGGFLACKNSRKTDPEKRTYLPFSLIKSIINNISAQHTFLTMDVCRDGTTEESLLRLIRRMEDDKPVAASAHQQWIENLLTQRSRIYLTTGGDRYSNSNGGQSQFVQGLLKALDQVEEERPVTPPDLLKHFQDLTPQPQFRPFGDNANSNGFVFEKGN